MPCRTGLNSDFSPAENPHRTGRRNRGTGRRRGGITVSGTVIRSHAQRMPPWRNGRNGRNRPESLPPAHYLN